jgi:cytochrome c-type biogenesis protein CcmE
LFKKKRFLIGGIIILAAVVFLAIQGFKSSAAYYYTVNETIQKGAAVYGQTLRVNGTVTGAVDDDIQTLTLRFAIADGGESIPVIYKGTTPDNFGPDTDVVVGGTIDSTGVLHADSIVTKCPSKYVAAN